jgi:hypothetical protein
MVQDPHKNAVKTTASAHQAAPEPTLRQREVGAMRSYLARDLTLAMLVKVVLLTGLIVTISRLAIRAPDSAAATAQAVAGIAASAETGR